MNKETHQERRRRRRHLRRFELLEDRCLLEATATLIDSDFKLIEGEIWVDDASANFVGETQLFEPGQRVVHDQYEGNHRERGTMKYSSATDGVGQFEGAGEGSGSLFLTIADNVIESTLVSYGFKYSGDSQVVDSAGTLTRAGQTVSGFEYTYVDPPTNFLTSQSSPYSISSIEGTFDTRDFSVSVSWSIDFSSDVFGVPGNAAGSLRGTLYPSDSNYDIILNDEETRWTDTGLQLSWSSPGAPQRTPSNMPSHTTPITNVQLYWADGPSFENVISEGLLSPSAIPVYWNQQSATYDIQNLPPAPDGSSHLLVFADPQGLVDESIEGTNNLVALERPQVIARSISITDNNMLKLDYAVFGTAAPFDIRVYWATGETSDRQIGAALPPIRHEPRSSVENSVQIPLRELATARPETATHLLLHVDSGHEIAEFNETDNVTSVDIRVDINVTAATWNYDEGGVNVEFEIKNRFWVTQDPSVYLFWSEVNDPNLGGTPAAPIQRVSAEQKNFHVPASQFVPPLADSQALVIRMDLDAQDDPTNDDRYDMDEGPDGIAIQLERAQPLVTILLPEAYRKAPYGVRVIVKNLAAVPLKYTLSWREQFPEIPVVRDNGTGGNVSRQGIEYVPEKPLAFNPPNCTDPNVCDGIVELNLHELDGNGFFNRTWDWIPPENEYVDAILKFAEDFKYKGLLAAAAEYLRHQGYHKLAEIVGAIKAAWTGFAIDEVYSGPSPRYDTVTLTYQVTAETTAGVDSEGSHTANLVVFVPDDRHSDLRAFQASAANGATGVSLGLVGIFAQPLVGIGLLLVSFNAYLDAADHYLSALDPPDPTFDVIAVPGRTLPVSALDDVESFWAAQADASSVIHGLTEAIVKSRDRVLGAREAGDRFWESEQLIALSEFAHRSAVAHTNLIHSRILAANHFGSLAAQTQTVRDQIAQNGVPEDVRRLLRSFDVDAEQLDLAIQSALQIPAEALEQPETYYVPLMQNAVVAMKYAVDDFLAGLRLRILELGKEVRQLTTDEWDKVFADQAVIEMDLEIGMPTLVLRDEITNFIQQIRDLLEQTGSIEELERYLEFGYGALLQFQLMDATPEALLVAISGFVDSNETDAVIANQLGEYMGRAQELFDEGDYTLAFQQIAMAQSLIDLAEPEYLDPRAREVLSNAVAYSVSLNDYQPLTLDGDVNQDGSVDSLDIDRLYAAIRDDESSRRFDLNRDEAVDRADVEVLVRNILGTSYGDANLDGEFASGDLVQVLQAGKYETQEHANWSEGDWDGDGVFTSSDFVTALIDGGYESGTRALPADLLQRGTDGILLNAIAAAVSPFDSCHMDPVHHQVCATMRIEDQQPQAVTDSRTWPQPPVLDLVLVDENVARGAIAEDDLHDIVVFSRGHSVDEILSDLAQLSPSDSLLPRI